MVNGCGKLVALPRMVQHVAGHQLLGHCTGTSGSAHGQQQQQQQQQVCGFCGGPQHGAQCKVELRKLKGVAHGAVKEVFNCSLGYKKLSLGAAGKASKNNPCTNIPIECPITGCTEVV